MTKVYVRELLRQKGIDGVVSTAALAETLGIGQSTVRKEKNAGRLAQCDRGVFEFEAVVEWLAARPRFLLRIGAGK